MVAAASSENRWHPPSSFRVRPPAAGHSGTSRRHDSSEGRVHRGATAHLRPRALRVGPRGLHPSRSPDQGPPRLTRVPGVGHRPPEPASPRLAARHSHFGGGSSGGERPTGRRT